MPIWGWHMIRAAVIAVLPIAAQAGGWDAFQARCVEAYENLFPPVLAGLQELPSPGNQPEYRLGDQQTLVIELVPDDGETACRLEDRTGRAEAEFDRWIGQGVKAERYEKVGKDSWQSYQWVEPVVAVRKWRDGDTVVLRILVSDLES